MASGLPTCAYSISCKMATLRAVRGLEPDDRSQDLLPLQGQEVEMMARVEHNRWNVEKLLMGFRKPRRAEDCYEHAQFGQELQHDKNLYIHADIRPFDTLTPNAQQLDREISQYIPWLLRMTTL